MYDKNGATRLVHSGNKVICFRKQNAETNVHRSIVYLIIYVKEATRVVNEKRAVPGNTSVQPNFFTLDCFLRH